MLSAIAERGPDRQGVACFGPVAMGQTLLATTPQDRYDQQPLSCEDSGLSLVADARIDNRRELFRLLGLDSGLEEELPDSLLLLHAYKRWGEKSPEQLIGDFAFVVWDRRRRQLFAARDRLGVRPLYYLCTPRLFAFASEIKALRSIPGPAFPINEAAIAGYFLRTVHAPAETFYSGINRLLPASRLQVLPERHREYRYWSPREVPPLILADDGAYGEAFAERFQEAVECRLRSCSPVGAALSGGLDSSSIVCSAAPRLAESGRPLRTYSAVYTGLSAEEQRLVDEGQFMAAVEEYAPVIPRRVEVGGIDPYATLSQELAWRDEPFFNPNLYIHRAMYTRAARDGVAVFLDGLDGDTVVSHGYELLPQLLLRGRWARFFSEIGWIRKRSRSRQGLLRLAARYGLRPLLARLADGVLLSSLKETRRCRHIFHPEFVQRNHPARLLRQAAATTLPVCDARAHHQASMALPYLGLALETSNHMAARYGIEERYPFLDSRVVEFCLAIPPEQKFRHGWSRMILRRAMEGVLPPGVQYRLSKANLSPHFFKMSRLQGQGILARQLHDPPEAMNQLFRPGYLEALLDPQAGESELLAVYTAVALGQWLAGTFDTGFPPSRE